MPAICHVGQRELLHNNDFLELLSAAADNDLQRRLRADRVCHANGAHLTEATNHSSIKNWNSEPQFDSFQSRCKAAKSTRYLINFTRSVYLSSSSSKDKMQTARKMSIGKPAEFNDVKMVHLDLYVPRPWLPRSHTLVSRPVIIAASA